MIECHPTTKAFSLYSEQSESKSLSLFFFTIEYVNEFKYAANEADDDASTPEI